MLLVALVFILRLRNRADRERVWAGMARESAHQLGTPLTSLSGWLELLGDREPLDALTRQAVANMKTDLERLERVAHRFERIGRPPRREDVDLAQVAERIGAYFKARVPKGARAVTIAVERPGEPVIVRGDAVLLDWVAEALTKNAIDALAGRGGRVQITAESLGDGAGRLRVADDGPGVPRELRRRIFDAGFSTKERGWGIGLSLARRIVEENHGGRLTLASTDRGAAFDVILE
jgi:signal transduction histidine kinase